MERHLGHIMVDSAYFWYMVHQAIYESHKFFEHKFKDIIGKIF